MGEGGVGVATGERPRAVAEAQPTETDPGSEWQPAQRAGTSLSLIGRQRPHSLFYHWVLKRAPLIGLLREAPPPFESYWMILLFVIGR